ncbi:choline/ethanolaminephosphotransferase 1 bbc isoform X2 [Brevipalpus obovatus]|uniref:choline/ethanolaminephosphotransferase 1 bbc isoform X2 n=1 Tax=Brevipalpus obovatus TaxID=246614 RepID=UPI003D9DCE80
MFTLGGEVLSERHLQKLTEHKYRSAGETLLDPIMQRFWTWFVNKLPLYWAPNLMTLTGLCVNVFTTIILVLYSPDAKQPIPGWALLFFGLGLFVYQTLDATDGKQARRTGTSSPLGELFDHGCDSVSTLFVSLATCLIIQLGHYPGWMFYFVMMAVALFYIAHWQTYVSSLLRFGRFDVTEVQFIVMFFSLVTTLAGQEFWSYKLPGLDVEMKIVFTFSTAIAHIVFIFQNLAVILAGGVGKNGSTVAGTSVLSPCIPLATVLVPALVIYQKSPHLFEEHPCLYLITFGLVMAKVTNRLVVSHMTKSEMAYSDSVLIGPAMLFLNQYFNNFLPEHFVLWLALICTVFDLIHYSVVVCKQIAGYLRINILTISSQPSSWASHRGSDRGSKASLNDDSEASETCIQIL